MKLIAATVILLLAGISALPQDENALSDGERRLITSRIQDAIDALIEITPDPVHLPNWSTEIRTPIGGVEAWAKDVKMEGQSNIQTLQMDWSTITRRLRITLRLPRVVLSTKSTGFEVAILGRHSSASISGSVELINLQLAGNFRFMVTPIGGVRMTDCNLVPSGRVESDAFLSMGGHLISLEGWAHDVTQRLHDNGAAIGQQICDRVSELM